MSRPITNPRRTLFWFELSLSQCIAFTWTTTGALLWGINHMQVRLPILLIAGLLFGNGTYFLSRGSGLLEIIRKDAPNPLIWPVLYTYSGAFLGLAGLLSICAKPSLLFIAGFSAVVLLTPFLCAPLVVITFHYILQYDIKELTTKIKSSHA